MQSTIDLQEYEMFPYIDQLLKEERFDEVSHILKSTDIANTSTDLLIGYLGITLAAHDKLPYRDLFFQKTKEELFRQGEDAEKILSNLEGKIQ